MKNWKPKIDTQATLARVRIANVVWLFEFRLIMHLIWWLIDGSHPNSWRFRLPVLNLVVDAAAAAHFHYSHPKSKRNCPMKNRKSTQFHTRGPKAAGHCACIDHRQFFFSLVIFQQSQFSRWIMLKSPNRAYRMRWVILKLIFMKRKRWPIVNFYFYYLCFRASSRWPERSFQVSYYFRLSTTSCRCSCSSKTFKNSFFQLALCVYRLLCVAYRWSFCVVYSKETTNSGNFSFKIWSPHFRLCRPLSISSQRHWRLS